jgi:hypothetical protein
VVSGELGGLGAADDPDTDSHPVELRGGVGRTPGDFGKRRGHGTVGVRGEHEDGLEARPRRAQQCQTIGLRTRVGMFVGPHAARVVRLGN